MTYKKIIQNFMWDGLIRDLTRQLSNKTRRDDTPAKTEAEFDSFWNELYEACYKDLTAAMTELGIQTDMARILYERLLSTYDDNYHDAKVIWLKLNGGR